MPKKHKQIGAVVATVVYGVTLMTVWTSTSQATGLFGVHDSDVLIDKVGLEHLLVGLGGFITLIIAVILALTRVAPRVGAFLATVVALAATVQLVIGDYSPSDIGVVHLTARIGLVVAVAAAWFVSYCLVSLARSHLPTSPTR